MGQSLTRKLLEAHLVSGKTVAGEEIGLRVDQALLTDTNETVGRFALTHREQGVLRKCL